jgi:hypothetical protein
MDFPSNSRNVTEKSTLKPKEEKNLTKVVSGEVTQKKKPLGQRFKNMITGVEFKGASQYVFFDVLIPAVKNMVVDAVDVGVKRMIYGDSAPRGVGGYGRTSRTTYNSPVNRGRDSVMLPKQAPHVAPSRASRPNDIVLNTREEAELVLSTMQDIIEKYDFASVSDFHTIVGLPSTYVDNNWGWSGLHYVNIRQVREGWLLDMPSVEPIQ